MDIKKLGDEFNTNIKFKRRKLDELKDAVNSEPV